MIKEDFLQRFLFTQARIRGEIICLSHTYAATTERHPYPPSVQQFLGQALAACALLSATIKYKGKLILQIQTEGPIELIVVQSNEKFHLRGLAKWEGDNIDGPFSQAFGAGHLAITITPDEGERYQGIVELDHNSLSSSLEDYFSQSEQLPTCICLFANETHAGGILLQAMPADKTEDQALFWEHLVHLTRTLTADEMLTLPYPTLLKRLYHEEDITLFEQEAVSFRCDCSIEKMEKALLVLGRKEVDAILLDKKVVTVTCEFCHYHYNFEKADIAQLFIGADDNETGTQLPH